MDGEWAVETLKRLEEELQEIERVLNRWGFASIEYRRVFLRTDGLPMLYLKARTEAHYLHIEGMVVENELRFYCKLTKSRRNKHSHKDEIIGWDNLYNDRPHVHFNEDARREYRQERIEWDEIRSAIEGMEAKR